MKHEKKRGFSLIELLSVISILAVIMTFVIYITINVMDNTKENGYKVVISEVENHAKDYFIENSSKLFFVHSKTDENYEYQCVSVKNLMDMGYFDNGILNSYISEDRKVSVDDYVYLLRDIDSKVLVKQEYVYNSEDEYDCASANDAIYDIGLYVSPSGWSKSKNITIYFNVKNVMVMEGYKFQYEYVLDGANRGEYLNSDGKRKEISVNKNGTLYARIITDGVNLYEREIKISNIDNENPVIDSIFSLPSSDTGWVNSDVVITASASDKQSGIVAYKFSNSADSLEGDWINVDSAKENITESYSVSSSGLYYFYVKDTVGNVGISSIMVNIDKNVPVYVSKSGSLGYYSIPTASFEDSESGIKEVRYLIVSNSNSVPEKNHSGFAASNVAKPLSCGTNYYVYAVAEDNAGNISEVEKVGDFYTGCSTSVPTSNPVCDWLCEMNKNQNSCAGQKQSTCEDAHQKNVDIAAKNCPNCTFDGVHGIWYDASGKELQIYDDDKEYIEKNKNKNK